MGEFGEKSTTCGTVCLKYLLFTFNCCFWLAGLAVMAVGIWTLALKSDYISLLASGTYLATAYILVVAGIVVMVTGALGCCATFKERRNLLRLVSRACRTEGGGGAPCQAARGWFWVRRA
ncbi:PREDICTED: CD151 antigen-like isoform X1 [Bison bison bison]|uniref:CD151 antigen-like isoform X1 n=1 Tax=Bison bison bison TaxID=43346 RepID=A0A6P3JAN4_BISBB|nr:PREDICTED: CD151 antigen-like isoform X1 [Bison bison bison]